MAAHANGDQRAVAWPTANTAPDGIVPAVNRSFTLVPG